VIKMTWMQDGPKALVNGIVDDYNLQLVDGRFCKRGTPHASPPGSRYEVGEPRKAGMKGIYFVDPTY